MLTGSVVVTPSVAGDCAPIIVELAVDGAPVGTSFVPPFSFGVNTALWPGGPHKLRACALDGAGNTACDEVDVQFANSPPSILAASPCDETVFFEDGDPTFSFDSEAIAGVAIIQIRANGLLVAECPATPSCETTVPWASLYVTPSSLPTTLIVQYTVIDTLGLEQELTCTLEVMSRLDWSLLGLGEIWGNAAPRPGGGIIYGHDAERVEAVDEASGAPLWSTNVEGGVINGLELAGDVVLVPTVSGWLYGLDPETGDILWPSGSTPSPGSPPSRPTLWNGIGYTTLYGGGALNDGAVYTFDPATGAPLWTAGLPHLSFSRPGVASDGSAWVGAHDHHLHTFTPEGLPGDTAETAGEIWAGPVLDSLDHVYVGSLDGRVYGVVPSGTIKWKAEVDAQVWADALVGSDGHIYVASTLNGRLWKLSPTSGEVVWNRSLGNFSSSAPIQGPDGTIFAVTSAGHLFALDPDSGETRWDIQLANTFGEVHATPIIVGDKLYVGATDTIMYAVWIL